MDIQTTEPYTTEHPQAESLITEITECQQITHIIQPVDITEITQPIQTEPTQNTQTEISENTQIIQEPACKLPFDLEHESCMKQQLLRHAIQNEVDKFMADAHCIHDLLYLDFVFNQMRNFSLLNTHQKAKEKLEEFVLSLPQFLTVSQRASKLDQQNKQLRVLIAGTFHVNFKTPLEREEDNKMLNEDYSRKVETTGGLPESEEERMRKAYFDKGQHELASVAMVMFLDMSQEGGVERFFQVIRDSPKLMDIPHIYQDFFRKLGKVMALNAERNYKDKDQVSKLKKMYKLTPMQAIKGILAITNPVKLVSGLLNLFLARPAGMQNIMQKIMATNIELKRTEKALKAARQHTLTLLKRLGPKVGPELLTHITKYLQTHELPIPDEEHFTENERGFKEVSYESLYNVEFVLDVLEGQIDVAKLQRTEIDAIHQIILTEIRLTEKRELINMLGSEKVISMIKELWTVFDEPVALLCRSNLGTHLERMFKCVKDIVKVSETAKQATIEERLEAYDKVLQRLQKHLYSFIHTIAVKDTGAFQQTFQWYMNILKCITGDPLDVQGLLSALPEDEQAKVVQEVRATVEYNRLIKQGQKPKHRPLDPTLTKLVPAFDEMVRSRLPKRESATPQKASDGAKKVIPDRKFLSIKLFN